MTPIDLYRIVMGSNVWTITSSDKSVVYAAETYIATAMKRGAFEQKNEISKSDMEVVIPIDHELALQMLTSYNEEVMSLTVFTKRDADIDVTWKGRLASIKPTDQDLTLVFESIFTSLRRPGLRARFLKSCRHALYGRGCNLNPEDFPLAGTVSALDVATLTIAAAAGYADGYFTGGMLRSPGGFLSYVTSHVGNQIVLQRVGYDLAKQWAETGPGLAVTLYPGCDHSRATCNSKFNNGLNYGGFDWIPAKNPMGGSSIV